MATFRLYLLCPNGRVSGGEWFAASSDDQAARKTRARRRAADASGIEGLHRIFKRL